MMAVIAYSDAPLSSMVRVERRHSGKTEIGSRVNPGKQHLQKYQV
jgi:hypothetical protein